MNNSIRLASCMIATFALILPFAARAEEKKSDVLPNNVQYSANYAIEPGPDTCLAGFEVCVIPIYMMPSDATHPRCYSTVRYAKTIAGPGIKSVIWALVDGLANKKVYQFEKDTDTYTAINLHYKTGFDPVGHIGKDHRFYIWKIRQIAKTSTQYDIFVKQVNEDGSIEHCDPGDPVIAND